MNVKKIATFFVVLTLVASIMVPMGSYAEGGAQDNAESVALSVEVEFVMAGIRDLPLKPTECTSDWILGLNTITRIPTLSERTDFLRNVRREAASSSTSIGTRAKNAIALSAIGVDPSSVPNAVGIATNQLETVRYYQGQVNPIYDAPLMLSLYDLDIFKTHFEQANYTRESLINSILTSQQSDGSFSSGDTEANPIDETSMVIPALSTYYRQYNGQNGISAEVCNQVTAAVDRSLSYLSIQQQDNGGFLPNNCASSSRVATALASLNVDANGDPRFIKNGNSVLNNVRSFRTTQYTFGYDNSTTTDVASSLMAFQSLGVSDNINTAWKTNLYNFDATIAPLVTWPSIDEAYETTDFIVSPPTKVYYEIDEEFSSEGMIAYDIKNYDYASRDRLTEGALTISGFDSSTPGTKTVSVTYKGLTETFVIVVNNEDGTTPPLSTVDVYVRDSSGRPVAVQEDFIIDPDRTTAMDALRTVLAQNRKALIAIDRSNVYRIGSLKSHDLGPLSMWMYMVNGETPWSYATNHKLSNGDVLLWKFSLDPATEVGFTDTADSWAKDFIEILRIRGIVNGLQTLTGEGTQTATTYAPENTITRAEFAQVIYNLQGNTDPITYRPVFNDVTSIDWFTTSAIWGYDSGIITGAENEDGTVSFLPNELITRQDMATILNRYIAQVYDKTIDPEYPVTPFEDESYIADYAKESVTQMQRYGIINGIDQVVYFEPDPITGIRPDPVTVLMFKPFDNGTRAEMAKMIAKLIQESY